MHEANSKVAVIGGGVAGIVAAYLLQRGHNVTLYEKNDYVGGHTHTIVIPKGPDAGTPIDTGFIVLNNRTYPWFIRFLSQLGVSIRRTDMSFGCDCRKTGLQYASSNFNTLFAQRLNLFRPSFWHLLMEIRRFCDKTRERLEEGKLAGITLGEFLKKEKFSCNVSQQYVIPMASAIWSASYSKMLQFPMESFARFYENHGLLSLTEHPQWYFISGGSHSYVKAFLKQFKGEIVTGCGIKGLRRSESGIALKLPDGTEKDYDDVVIAAHADEALALLSDPSDEETLLLSAWEYSRNHVILHTDPSMMPSNRGAWASWNYIREKDNQVESPITVTYYMNRLQKLKTKHHYCVTLNPVKPVSDEHIIEEMEYTHPQYTFNAIKTQNKLADLNGKRNTFFCGSYFGYGFHEDAVRSALEVGRKFGIEL